MKTLINLIFLIVTLCSSGLQAQELEDILQRKDANGQPFNGSIDTLIGDEWPQKITLFYKSGNLQRKDASHYDQTPPGIWERTEYKEGKLVKRTVYQVVGSTKKTIKKGRASLDYSEGGEYGEVPESVIIYYPNGSERQRVEYFPVNQTGGKAIVERKSFYLEGGGPYESKKIIHPKKVEYYIKNGKLYGKTIYYNKGIFTGKIHDLYANGDISSEYYLACREKKRYGYGSYDFNYVNKIGPIKNYYENGQLRSEGNYAKTTDYDQSDSDSCDWDTAESGNWKFYYSNGQLKSEGEMKNGEPIGEWKFYDIYGNIDSKGYYKKNGERSGLWTVYNSTGKLIAELNFETKVNQDYKGKMKTFNNQGTLSGEGRFRTEGLSIFDHEETIYDFEIVPHGEWKTYHENGDLSSEGEYWEGTRKNKWVFIDSNGDKRKEKFEKW